MQFLGVKDATRIIPERRKRSMFSQRNATSRLGMLIVLFPGDMGRIYGWSRYPLRHTDGYRSRFWGVDEPELPPGWYGSINPVLGML